MTDWFARPVLHVTDVAASVRFYVEGLGFTPGWRHETDGKPVVAQVDRDGCALILASTWADKAGGGAMFISLNTQPPSSEAQVIALDTLRAEFAGKGVPMTEGPWGYRVVIVEDPDGNTLMFNYTD